MTDQVAVLVVAVFAGGLDAAGVRFGWLLIALILWLVRRTGCRR